MHIEMKDTSRRYLSIVVAALFLSSALAVGCGDSGGGSSGGGGDRTRAGGATTSDDRSSLAFENPAPNMNDAELDEHLVGDVNFGAKFVSPPAPVNGGLGPLFNNNSCESCHVKNGRGLPVFGTGPQGSQAVLRASIPDGEPEVPGGAGLVPGFGTQLQDHGIFGTTPEVSISLNYETIDGTYGDGTGYQLRKPKLNVRALNGERLPSNTLFSLRSPPPIFGLGLLEAVSEEEILAIADPGDADGDGISGRPNMVWDVIESNTRLGRFGRKANRPTILQQVAAAYINDIGVTNPVFPASDGSTEIDDVVLKSVEFYTQSLAVPRAETPTDPQVQQGEILFGDFQCATCHRPQMRTGSHPASIVANQRIAPFTDMLLHDMGEGLADGRPDFVADGNEWRTPPLWGIGVTATILSSTATYLHDGRARTLEEAILWHGGEAEQSRERFRNAQAADRHALIRFLRSL